MMVCMIFRVKQSIWKSFRSMKLDLEIFGFWLENWFRKLKRKDDEMNRGYRRIGTYFTTQRIHQEIRSHKLASQGNPPKILENKIYTSPSKEST